MSSAKSGKTSSDYDFLTVTADMTSDDLKIPCVVKASASWCGPCHKMQPDYVKLAKTYGNKINFYMADIDVCEEFVNEFKITSIPKLVFCPTDEKAFISNKISDIEDKIKEFTDRSHTPSHEA